MEAFMLPEHYPQRLRSQDQEIRVLDLRPGTFHSPLEASISTVRLPDSPVYGALSYVWGDTSSTGVMFMNEWERPITKNLEIALRHIREEEQGLLLWIDALCINQADIEERNEQVRMMDLIYSSATQVIVWIGEGDNQSDMAFESMDGIAKEEVDKALSREVIDAMGLIYINLYQRPWFSRVWVLQELALAKNEPSVRCGFKMVTWTVFVVAWRKIAKKMGLSESELLYFRPLSESLHKLREDVNSQGGRDLVDVLVLAGRCVSSVPQDRVFALLGLLKSDDRECCTVDYSQSTSALFTDVTKHIFAKGSGMELLTRSLLHGGRSKIQGLPSWVPDFDGQLDPEKPSAQSNRFNPRYPNSVSGVLDGTANGVSHDLKELEEEILAVDVIDCVISFDRNPNRRDEELLLVEAVAEQARQIELNDENSKSFFERARTQEAVWQVLSCNTTWRTATEVAPLTYESSYKELLKAPDDQPAFPSQELEDVKACLEYRLPGNTFFTTQNGLQGIGAPDALNDDKIVILFGAIMPFIVRPVRGVEQTYKLIGPCYVGGIMEGQFVNELYEPGFMKSETIFIV